MFRVRVLDFVSVSNTEEKNSRLMYLLFLSRRGCDFAKINC